MENRSPIVFGVNRDRTGKLVKFCFQCSVKNKCKVHEKTFQLDGENGSTSFHQLNTDITCWFSESSTDMIADIGCPNSVIGVKDELIFRNSLSQFQQESLRIQKVDAKFKFGPSGPYKCEKRLSFPIYDGSKEIIAEVAVVNADIPMLLGNNFFKPLGAQFKLFETGNGVLNLKNIEIDLKETSGGHYTLKASDLRKLCGTAKKSQDMVVPEGVQYFKC